MTEETQSECHSDKPAKKGVEKFPKPVMEKPAKPILEKPSKTATKPAPTDSFTKQASDKSNKSPPPPPPRKTYSSLSSGMTTTRSGEVVYTSRKDSVSAQVSLVSGYSVKCGQTAAVACFSIVETLKRNREENSFLFKYSQSFVSCTFRFSFFFQCMGVFVFMCVFKLQKMHSFMQW